MALFIMTEMLNCLPFLFSGTCVLCACSSAELIMEVGALSQEPAKTEAVSSESGKKRKKKQEEEEKKFVMSEYLGETMPMPIDYLAIDTDLTHGQV